MRYDTCVRTPNQDRALSVDSLEPAHSRHVDVVAGTEAGAGEQAFGFGVQSILVGGARLRRASAVPAVMALLAVRTHLATPVENSISSRIETRWMWKH